MRINADFSLRASVTPDAYRWVPSPQAGVERVMLDRVGAEIARATSIVRYAPQSSFPAHHHPGGEEILVLAGTFSDEAQDYPAGWYLRNPPGSSHRPSSREGATIFVKLWQMHPAQSLSVRIDTRNPASWVQEGERWLCPLFADARETVQLQRLRPGQAVAIDGVGLTELLVLEGVLQEADAVLECGSWLRLPVHHRPALCAGAQGVTIYLKTTQTQESMP